jgi:hypothetical protein
MRDFGVLDRPLPQSGDDRPGARTLSAINTLGSPAFGALVNDPG